MSKYTPSPYGKWLRQKRTQRGLTVTELAVQTSIQRTNIHFIESDRVQLPYFTTRWKLSRALREDPPDNVVDSSVRENRKDRNWNAESKIKKIQRPPSAYGVCLRHTREKAGLSQTNLAIEASVHRITIVHIEAGRIQWPHMKTCMRLSAALKAEPLSLEYMDLYDSNSLEACWFCGAKTDRELLFESATRATVTICVECVAKMATNLPRNQYPIAISGVKARNCRSNRRCGRWNKES